MISYSISFIFTKHRCQHLGDKCKSALSLQDKAASITVRVLSTTSAFFSASTMLGNNIPPQFWSSSIKLFSPFFSSSKSNCKNC